VSRRSAAALVAVPFLLAALQVAAVGALSPQTAPPPTPVPPNGSPSPYLERLETPSDPLAVPAVEAPSALLVDLSLGQVLFERAASEARPVASLTKVMTALLVLERDGDRLDRPVRVHPDAVFGRRDFGAGSTLGLRPGERVSVEGLLGGLLLGSANDAAEALAIDASGSVARFVERMNARAADLGMRRTRFASPHGLDDDGRSTASDLALLLRAALEVPAFPDLVSRRTVTIASAGRTRRIQNRNALLWLYPGATGVKTGSTPGAGYCLIATARRGDRELAAIVLGGRDEVFSDAAALLNHGFEAYELRTLVRSGERLGSVAVRGGTVPVVAGEDVVALVGTGPQTAVERSIVARDGVGYPPPAGATIGWVTLRGPSGPIGRGTIVVADLGPPVAPSGPWWARAAAALARGVTAAVEGLFG
jgi:serine-type D-Ala-D-Ala carboxypeptidase (penicillin-binding protein 5/6)